MTTIVEFLGWAGADRAAGLTPRIGAHLSEPATPPRTFEGCCRDERLDVVNKLVDMQRDLARYAGTYPGGFSRQHRAEMAAHRLYEYIVGAPDIERWMKLQAKLNYALTVDADMKARNEAVYARRAAAAAKADEETWREYAAEVTK